MVIKKLLLFVLLWTSVFTTANEFCGDKFKHDSVFTKGSIKKTFSIDDFSILGFTPLMEACLEGSEDLSKVNDLINDGAVVNAIDFWEQPHGGTTVLGYAILGGSSEIINELIQAGVNPNGVINRGIHIGGDIHVRIISVLTYAISENMHIGIIKQLIDAGADVNATCTIGFNMTTPLIVASALGQVDMIKLLLSNGADKNHKNCFNKMAIDYAKEYGFQDVIFVLEQ